SSPLVIPQMWTPELAVQYALETNPSVVQARAELENATGVRMQVRAQLLPHVNLTGNYNTKERSLLDVNPLSITADPYTLNNYQVALEFRQLLFDGFQTFNAFRERRYSEQSAYWGWINATYAITAQVQQSYDAILYRQGVVDAYKESVGTYAKIADVSKRREAAGDVTPLDGLRAQTELRAAEAQLAAAMSDLAASQETFRRLLQLPFAEDMFAPIVLQGPLHEKGYSLTLDQSLKKTGDSHPDIVAARLKTTAAQAGIYSVRGAYAPKVEMFANYSTQNSQFEAASSSLNGWVVGVQGRWEIFDYYGREGAIVSKKAALRSAESELAEKRYQLSSRVRELFAQKEAMAQSITAQRAAVDFGMQSVQEGGKLYMHGGADIEILLDAQSRLSRSQVDLCKGLFDFNSFVYQLEYVVGMEPPSSLPTLDLN
ncbi:MAG TPA: TolC family protein, partial [Opitutales bacterium]|nr:TolC family protein [Opitutales bacterium]